MAPLPATARTRAGSGLLYAWSGFAVMWTVWVCFVVFLSEPHRLLLRWPLSTVDHGGWVQEPWAAALIDLSLVALFGLQHSVMARPWFKRTVMGRMPPAFERSTYVHMANLALFVLIVFWQPISIPLWNTGKGSTQDLMWVLFAAGWVILFLGAWSFGIRDLLGIEQMRAWAHARQPHRLHLKTGFLYRWLRHPMYVGVLMGVWATPRMSLGHALLALSFTGYVLIAMRYEERDLLKTFGARYASWREVVH